MRAVSCTIFAGMRFALAAVVCLLALDASAQPVVLPVDYVLVAQRPDEGGAVRVPWQSWGPCCSAFSASTTSLYHPTPPATWVQFQVHMTARSADDAVRLRITDTATGATHVMPAEGLTPPVAGLPRTVAVWLDVAAWNARDAEHVYALEVRGQPVIYGAKLRVGYAWGTQP